MKINYSRFFNIIPLSLLLLLGSGCATTSFPRIHEHCEKKVHVEKYPKCGTGECAASCGEEVLEAKLSIYSEGIYLENEARCDHKLLGGILGRTRVLAKPGFYPLKSKTGKGNFYDGEGMMFYESPSSGKLSTLKGVGFILPQEDVPLGYFCYTNEYDIPAHTDVDTVIDEGTNTIRTVATHHDAQHLESHRCAKEPTPLNFKRLSVDQLPKNNVVSKTITFNGRNGNCVHFVYREKQGDGFGDTHEQDINFDCSESKVFKFKGAEIEILEVKNNEIKYRVNKQFEV